MEIQTALFTSLSPTQHSKSLQAQAQAPAPSNLHFEAKAISKMEVKHRLFLRRYPTSPASLRYFENIIIFIQLLALDCKVDNPDHFAFTHGTSYNYYVLKFGMRKEVPEIEPRYSYWLQKVNETPPKQYPWAIIDEDVFDYTEAHPTEAQSELKGFIKEACNLTSSIVYSHVHTRNSFFSETFYQEQSIFAHNTQT
ncbi:hypothetical protein BHYA_0487g00020 [Botrytis hyacinthi]|uniref:Uncharacterized protein n=1 Tax=Botrytis hyacinthi TaxID=278943 RepID=A0A4Z1GC50_9HELO|nr:hypothetical protein BHYA_0487g00020 [Botrytis hyacinthi]